MNADFQFPKFWVFFGLLFIFVYIYRQIDIDLSIQIYLSIYIYSCNPHMNILPLVLAVSCFTVWINWNARILLQSFSVCNISEHTTGKKSSALLQVLTAASISSSQNSKLFSALEQLKPQLHYANKESNYLRTD